MIKFDVVPSSYFSCSLGLPIYFRFPNSWYHSISGILLHIKQNIISQNLDWIYVPKMAIEIVLLSILTNSVIRAGSMCCASKKATPP